MAATTLECQETPQDSSASWLAVKTILAVFAARRRRRRQRAELERLGERTLRDIGLERTRFGWHVLSRSIAEQEVRVAKGGLIDRIEEERR